MGSRTIKVLAALLVAMTVGAFALAVLDRDPIRPAAHLAALSEHRDGLAGLIDQTDVPLSPIRWRNLILHSTGSCGAAMAERCHFVVDAEGQVRATELWRLQADGLHTYIRGYNAESIGICLVGELDSQPPSRSQFEALVGLTNALQRKLNIYPAQVYLGCEIDSRTSSPGAAFPSRAFAQRLLGAR